MTITQYRNNNDRIQRSSLKSLAMNDMYGGRRPEGLLVGLNTPKGGIK